MAPMLHDTEPANYVKARDLAHNWYTPLRAVGSLEKVLLSSQRGQSSHSAAKVSQQRAELGFAASSIGYSRAYLAGAIR